MDSQPQQRLWQRTRPSVHCSRPPVSSFHSQHIVRLQAARPERAEALSPGQRPGLSCSQTCRPVRAKALNLLALFKAFALTGRIADCHYTQGAALG